MKLKLKKLDSCRYLYFEKRGEKKKKKRSLGVDLKDGKVPNVRLKLKKLDSCHYLHFEKRGEEKIVRGRFERWQSAERQVEYA